MFEKTLNLSQPSCKDSFYSRPGLSKGLSLAWASTKIKKITIGKQSKCIFVTRIEHCSTYPRHMGISLWLFKTRETSLALNLKGLTFEPADPGLLESVQMICFQNSTSHKQMRFNFLHGNIITICKNSSDETPLSKSTKIMAIFSKLP